ncbi:MAG: polysaccharide deacetylase family protein [Candidatus Edwardsbacteria bacterium]
MNPLFFFVLFLLAFFIVCFVGLWLFWLWRYGQPGKDFVPILVYHKIDTKFELGGTWNIPRQFARQMNYLKENNYQPLSLNKLIEYYRTGKQPVAKSFVLTFDDGYENIYTYAYPVLKENGFTATIFVVTDFIGKENTWDVNFFGRKFRQMDLSQIQEMAKAGFIIGSHTKTHSDLTRMNPQEVKRELKESKEILEQHLNVPVQFLSYPFGRYNQKVEEIAEEAGYLAACAFYPTCPPPAMAGFGRRERQNNIIDFFALKRTGVYIVDTTFDLKIKLNPKSPLYWIEDITGRIINFCANGTIIFKKRALKNSLSDF